MTNKQDVVLGEIRKNWLVVFRSMWVIQIGFLALKIDVLLGF